MHLYPLLLLLIHFIPLSSCFLFQNEDVNMCRTVPHDIPCTCDTFNKLLNCAKTNLTFLYDSMAVPSGIEKLDFSKNSIKEVKSTHFDRVGGVQQLDLSENLISEIAFDAFRSFTELKILKLSHNAIKLLDMKLFGGLELLQELDVSYNQLNNLSPESSLTLMSLTHLQLHYNPLGNALINNSKMFDNMPRLQFVNLEKTDITGLHGNLFENNHLKGLNLARNSFQKVPISAIDKIKDSLQLLVLSDNHMKVIENGSLPNLPRLQTLSLNNMKFLKSVEDYAFKDLINLRVLEMHYNPMLESISPKAFHTENKTIIPDLRELHLRRNSLQRISHQMLKWHQIQTLDLQENPWVCDCSMHWTKALLNEDTLKEMECVAPKRLASKSIASIPPKDLKCGLAEVMMDILIVLFCVLILAILVSIYAVCRYILWKNDGFGYNRINAGSEKIELEWDQSDLGYMA